MLNSSIYSSFPSCYFFKNIFFWPQNYHLCLEFTQGMFFPTVICFSKLNFYDIFLKNSSSIFNLKVEEMVSLMYPQCGIQNFSLENIPKNNFETIFLCMRKVRQHIFSLYWSRVLLTFGNGIALESVYNNQFISTCFSSL